MVHLLAALLSTALLIGGIAFIGWTIARRLDAIIAALDLQRPTAVPAPLLPMPGPRARCAPRSVRPRTALRPVPRRAAA